MAWKQFFVSCGYRYAPFCAIDSVEVENEDNHICIAFRLHFCDGG